jgi:hypothetical protein
VQNEGVELLGPDGLLSQVTKAVLEWRASCRQTGTAGWANGLGKRPESNPGTAPPQADSAISHRDRPDGWNPTRTSD